MEENLGWLTRKFAGRRELNVLEREDVLLEEHKEPIFFKPKPESNEPAKPTNPLADIPRGSKEYPPHFYASQKLLESYRIKGEVQVEIARQLTPEQIRNRFTRLEHILALDTSSFAKHVPWFFTYNNGQFESYLRTLAQANQRLHAQFGYNLPRQYDWKRTPSSFRDIESLNEIQRKLDSLIILSPAEIEAAKEQKLRDALAVYSGKKIIFIGVREPHQEEQIRRYIPTSAQLNFHRGEDLRGLTGQYLDFDVVVITGGIATHKIEDRLIAEMGQGFYDKRLKVEAVNPMRVLGALIRDSYRFK